MDGKETIMKNKMGRENRKKEEGFTLIEVLVTTVVLAGALIALLSCFIYGYDIITRMKQVAVATQGIQEELEEIRDKTFDEVLALDNSFSNGNMDRLGQCGGCSDVSGSRTVEDTGIGNDIRRLTLTVQWTYRQRTMKKEIATFITREGINKR